MRICNDCKEEKVDADFPKSASKGRCRACWKIKMHIYYIEHKEAIKKRSQARYAKNRKRILARLRERRKKEKEQSC